MAEFRISMTRKQRYIVTVEAPSEWEAMKQAEVLIKQPGSEASSIFVGENFGDIDIEIIPPARLIPENFTDIVADLCDICGSVTVMGVNDVFLDDFESNLLVCTECYLANRENICTRYEEWEGPV